MQNFLFTCRAYPLLILQRQSGLDGLPRHNVHIAVEEHAATRPLAHRLDKGVLDLGEGSALRDSVLVLDDLGGADEEERVVAGGHLRVADDRALLVRLAHGSEARRVAHVALMVREVEVHLALTDRHTEGNVVRFVQRVVAHEHTHNPSVHRLAERVKHGADQDIGEADATVGVQVDAVSRPADLVHHRHHAVVGMVVIRRLRHHIVTGVDAVGLTIGDNHEGRNLNLVFRDPLLHELTDRSDSLHRGSAVQREAAGSLGALVVVRSLCLCLVHERTVQVRHHALTIRSRVAGREEVEQPGESVLNGGGLGVDDLRVVGSVVEVALTALPLPLAEGSIVLLAVNVRGRAVGEAEHLKRNLCLLAEPHQLKQLKDAVAQTDAHATGEVQHEHHAVVLAVLLDDLADEDIVMGAVLMEAVKVQHPGLLGTLTPNLVRSLLALKLRDHLTNERIGVTNELAVAVHVDGTVVALLKLLEQKGRGDDDGGQVLERGDGDTGGGELLAALVLRATGREVLDGISHQGFPALLATRLLLLLHLLHDFLHGRVIVQTLGDLVDLREGGHAVDLVRDLLLLVGEVDRQEALNAPLEVEVEAVDERGFLKVHLGEAEQVAVHDLLVAQEEVAASAGELLLHHLFDADILHHIGDPLKQHGVVAFSLRSLEDGITLLRRSPQRVADLVRDQHGLHGFRHSPHREREVTLLDIEGRGFRLRVKAKGQVLGGESAGENGERSVHARIVTDGMRGVNPQQKNILLFLRGPISPAGGYYQGAWK